MPDLVYPPLIAEARTMNEPMNTGDADLDLPASYGARKKESSMTMSKSDTLSAIMELNGTAKPDFLVEFSNDELARYLDRLLELPGSTPESKPRRTVTAATRGARPAAR